MCPMLCMEVIPVPVPAEIKAGDTVQWIEPAQVDLLGAAATSATWTFTTYLRTNTASEGATVAGTAKVGSRLTCTKTEANAWPAVKTSYRWLRNGRVILGARSRTYAPTAKDQGANVTCRVSVTYGVTYNQLGSTAKARTIR